MWVALGFGSDTCVICPRFCRSIFGIVFARRAGGSNSSCGRPVSDGGRCYARCWGLADALDVLGEIHDNHGVRMHFSVTSLYICPFPAFTCASWRCCSWHRSVATASLATVMVASGNISTILWTYIYDSCISDTWLNESHLWSLSPYFDVVCGGWYIFVRSCHGYLDTLPILTYLFLFAFTVSVELIVYLIT